MEQFICMLSEDRSFCIFSLELDSLTCCVLTSRFSVSTLVCAKFHITNLLEE